MADWPVRGEEPWGDKVKAYIDDGLDSVADAGVATMSAHIAALDPHTQYMLRTSTVLSNATNLNSVITGGLYLVNTTADWAARNLPTNDNGHLWVMRSGASILQFFAQTWTGQTLRYYRSSSNTGSTWGNWSREGQPVMDAHTGSADPHTQYVLRTSTVTSTPVNLNTVTTPGFWLANYSADWAARNFPVGDGGHLLVMRQGASLIQRFQQTSSGSSLNFTRTSLNNGDTWGNWTPEGAGIMATHVGASDPHPVYVRDAELPIITTNLVRNPNFEVDTATWSTGANATIARSTVRSRNGTASGLITRTVTTVGNAFGRTDVTTVVGTTYTESVWVYPLVDGVRLHAGFGGPTTTAPPGSVGTWIRLSLTYTATATSTAIYVSDDGAVTPVVGDIAHIDSVMTTAGSYVYDFFDGTQQGARWTGTAHNSTSELVLVRNNESVPSHVTQSDPHTQYVRKDGSTMTGVIRTQKSGATMAEVWRTDATNPNAKRWQEIVDLSGNLAFETLDDAGAWQGQAVAFLRAGGLSIGGSHYKQGVGSPEGVLTAPVGSRYVDTTVTRGAVEWIKRTGSGNTGWYVVAGDTEWRTITANLENGWTAAAAFLRRTAETVFFSVAGLNGTAATSDTIFTLPVGFQGHQSVFARLTGVDGATVKTLQAAAAQLNWGNVNGTRTTCTGMQVSGSWAPNTVLTHQWPATLPGVAS